MWSDLETSEPPRGTRAALFRGLRQHNRRHAGQPALDEMLQPRALRDIVHRAAGEMVVARARARRLQPIVAARGPARHDRVGHVGVELEAEGMAVADRL